MSGEAQRGGKRSRQAKKWFLVIEEGHLLASWLGHGNMKSSYPPLLLGGSLTEWTAAMGRILNKLKLGHTYGCCTQPWCFTLSVQPPVLLSSDTSKSQLGHGSPGPPPEGGIRNCDVNGVGVHLWELIMELIFCLHCDTCLNSNNSTTFFVYKSDVVEAKDFSMSLSADEMGKSRCPWSSFSHWLKYESPPLFNDLQPIPVPVASCSCQQVAKTRLLVWVWGRWTQSAKWKLWRCYSCWGSLLVQPA